MVLLRKKMRQVLFLKFLLRTLIKGKRNPESLISGRIAGVNVTGGGSPGAKADIRIRGGLH
jgi:hypothetical protein